MIGHACFVAALAATVAFAGQNEERGCESESNGDRQTRNAVVFWNEVADHSIADLGGRGPPLGSVETAIVHTAVYDAVNAICGYQFTPYAVMPEVRRPALPEAAVAAAARDVLVALYPSAGGAGSEICRVPGGDPRAPSGESERHHCRPTSGSGHSAVESA